MPVPTQSLTRYLDPEILRSIESIELAARVLVEGLYASRHRCPFYGFTVEFKDYREYAPGDPPRLIDWKLLARTERYFVRRYEMESNMDVVTLLDVSGSMGYTPTDTKRFSKIEYASYLAASLSYLVRKQQDSAGLITFGDDLIEFVPPRQGQRHMLGLLARLEEIKPEGPTNLEHVMKRLVLRLKRRSIIALISDCHGDPAPVVDGIRHLAARGHDIIVFHLLDSDEVEFPFTSLTSFRDVESGTQLMCDPLRQKRRYLARLDAFRSAIRDGTVGCGADYRFIDTSQPLETVLRDYLMYRRQRG
jgi:uncharacterized protein (DUF58 family)